jgi:tRNA 2-selenouridine synthase
MSIRISDFLLRRQELPVIDVRSENEFLEGHIPGAINIPLLNNQERAEVGTDYKRKGQASAIKTGLRLVGPRLLEIVTATEQVAAGREVLVHCWRGGMRSAYFCQFVGMAQIKATPLIGGYKAYRTQVMEMFERPLQLITLAGCTGSGKTALLQKLAEKGEQVIDLEALAHHKGSVFGGLQQLPQPTTEQFQNKLFERLITVDPKRPVWVEDESITIGRIFLPDAFWHQMSQSPVVEVLLPKFQRTHRLVAEYGTANTEEFVAAIQKISKRLGRLAQQQAIESVRGGEMHRAIDILLTYYDRAYEFGLGKKMAAGRILQQVAWNGTDGQSAIEQLQRFSANLRTAAAQ